MITHQYQLAKNNSITSILLQNQMFSQLLNKIESFLIKAKTHAHNRSIEVNVDCLVYEEIIFEEYSKTKSPYFVRVDHKKLSWVRLHRSVYFTC